MYDSCAVIFDPQKYLKLCIQPICCRGALESVWHWFWFCCFQGLTRNYRCPSVGLCFDQSSSLANVHPLSSIQSYVPGETQPRVLEMAIWVLINLEASALVWRWSLTVISTHLIAMREAVFRKSRCSVLVDAGFSCFKSVWMNRKPVEV